MTTAGETQDAKEDTRHCVLCSSDGETFTVLQSAASLSVLVREMLGDEEGDDVGEEQPELIPLPNVSGKVLAKVITFLEHHRTDPMVKIEKPLKSSKMEEVVGEWYANYCDIPMESEQELLYDVIRAANYMDIKPLLDLMCAKVASMIKGRTPEELRQTFNITNDFTPEEEKEVREANSWAETDGTPKEKGNVGAAETS